MSPSPEALIEIRSSIGVDRCRVACADTDVFDEFDMVGAASVMGGF